MILTIDTARETTGSLKLRKNFVQLHFDVSDTSQTPRHLFDKFLCEIIQKVYIRQPIVGKVFAFHKILQFSEKSKEMFSQGVSVNPILTFSPYIVHEGGLQVI